jgi:hypothetical protein
MKLNSSKLNILNKSTTTKGTIMDATSARYNSTKMARVGMSKSSKQRIEDIF